ncbi:hypothetical protein RJZ57_000766 [Blastomyces gilchristii]
MDPPSTYLPKPPVPYVEGWVFTAHSHIPPPPTRVTKDYCRNFQTGRAERRQLLSVEQCLRHPPLPGSIGSCTVDLKILNLLRVGDGCNAQVFTVKVLKTRPNPRCFQSTRKLVAEIYDPLYFNDEEGFINPFLCVDKHYTHETHAYGVLSKLQGEQVPRFYRNVIMVEKPGFDPKQSLLFLDFADALFGRRRDDPVAIRSNLFLGQYISPLLRWDKTMAMQFNDWIDWDWQPWIEAEYTYTAAAITPEMRDTYGR